MLYVCARTVVVPCWDRPFFQIFLSTWILDTHFPIFCVCNEIHIWTDEGILFFFNFRLSCKIKLEAHPSLYWSPVLDFQKKIFHSFHILSYVNLQSIKIGFLVLSYFCNSKIYNKSVAILQTDIFSKEFNRQNRLKVKKVIILGSGPFHHGNHMEITWLIQMQVGNFLRSPQKK